MKEERKKIKFKSRNSLDYEIQNFLIPGPDQSKESEMKKNYKSEKRNYIFFNSIPNLYVQKY